MICTAPNQSPLSDFYKRHSRPMDIKSDFTLLCGLRGTKDEKIGRHLLYGLFSVSNKQKGFTKPNGDFIELIYE